MKIFTKVVVVILVLLAVSSGVTKVMLMPQDVDFFAEFGFTNPILIAFGALQLLCGLLFAVRKSRIIGGLIVAVTFLLSAVLLAIAGNLPVAAVTLVCVVLLGMVIQQSRNPSSLRGDDRGT